MTKAQETTRNLKRISTMAQANGKTEMSAMAIRVTLAATTIVCAAVAIIGIAKVAGL